VVYSKWPIFKRLGLHADDEDDPSTRTFDIVSIPLQPDSCHMKRAESPILTLIGCSVRNKWILPSEKITVSEEEHVICHDDDYINNDSDAKPPLTFFDIY
ncbi:hypothetical protein BCR42DRAFT_429517, partial [Absidia repens]